VQRKSGDEAMLIRFAAANHRSIREAVELSLVAVDQDRPAVRSFDRLHEGVLTVAAIYGPNASGKSNVLDALAWLSKSVRGSLYNWQDAIPQDPFRFGGSADEPSVYEVDFLIDGIRHLYSLQVDGESVLYEELLSYPERKPRQLFVREGRQLRFRRGTGGAAAIQELMTPTTLVLSLVRRFDIKGLAAPAQFIDNIHLPFARRGGVPTMLSSRATGSGSAGATRRLFVNEHRNRVLRDERVRSRWTPEDDEDVRIARTLLRLADLGIEDIAIVEDAAAGTGRSSLLDIRFVHRLGGDSALFDLSEESDGTQMWFRLIGPVLGALRRGSPLLLDEIDASLHPLLSMQLLDLFRNPETNPRNAQLIFTTHDTTLLGELNRDEVWLTEKGADGGTVLTGLAEFGGDRVRRSLNLERAYLQGRFGGLPQIRSAGLMADVMRNDALLDIGPDGHLEVSNYSLPGSAAEESD
jgi:energy-coupling factor transporter ATP-binding protein EcfA2